MNDAQQWKKQLAQDNKFTHGLSPHGDNLYCLWCNYRDGQRQFIIMVASMFYHYKEPKHYIYYVKVSIIDFSKPIFLNVL